MKTIALLLSSLLVAFAFSQANTIDYETVHEKKKEFVNGVIIEKKFINKVGEALDFGELYLRSGKHDYFIKLADSSVKKDELMAILGLKKRFKVAFKEGLWDTDSPNVQSRTGEYVVILEIL
ncbi:MAG: hypothetical protein ABJG68_06990 [Crocinitomicaceae bacterium]